MNEGARAGAGASGIGARRIGAAGAAGAGAGAGGGAGATGGLMHGVTATSSRTTGGPSSHTIGAPAAEATADRSDGTRPSPFTLAPDPAGPRLLPVAIAQDVAAATLSPFT